MFGSSVVQMSDVVFLAGYMSVFVFAIILLFCTYLVQGWCWCSEWCCVCVWATRKEWREEPWGRPRIHRLDHVFIILCLMIQLELSREAPWGYIGPAWSRFHLQLDHVIPHSHIIPQPGNIHNVFIFTFALLNRAQLNAVFIFSWIVIHALVDIHVSWKTRLLIRVSHTLYLSFLLHRQDFRKPNFTLQKTTKITKNTKNVSEKVIYIHFFHSFWKNIHLTENFYTDMSVVSVTNMRYVH